MEGEQQPFRGMKARNQTFCKGRTWEQTNRVLLGTVLPNKPSDTLLGLPFDHFGKIFFNSVSYLHFRDVKIYSKSNKGSLGLEIQQRSRWRTVCSDEAEPQTTHKHFISALEGLLERKFSLALGTAGTKETKPGSTDDKETGSASIQYCPWCLAYKRERVPWHGALSSWNDPTNNES